MSGKRGLKNGGVEKSGRFKKEAKKKCAKNRRSADKEGRGKGYRGELARRGAKILMRGKKTCSVKRKTPLSLAPIQENLSENQ